MMLWTLLYSKRRKLLAPSSTTHYQCALTLATQNLAFRGHRKESESGNRGNFLSVIELLSKYDPLLEDLLSKPEGSVKYLHHKHQDEIINLLAKQVRAKIVDQIQCRPFFTIITDTTQDVSKTDQLTQIFRYVTLEKDERGLPKEIKINESFLGFHPVTDQHSESLVVDILKCMETNGLMLSKLRGQGYDGATNMNGVYSGVQARFQEKQPLAIYVHCMAHNLNLALNDSCDNVNEVKNFYDLMEKLSNSFKTVRRWATLQKTAQTGENVALKRVFTTRWSSRKCAIQSLRFAYAYILIVLSQLELNGNDNEVKRMTAGLK